MTWHKVNVCSPSTVRVDAIRNGIVVYTYLKDMRKWCEDNLGTQGTLWTNDIYEYKNRWFEFFFINPEDAILFRLKFGI